MEEKAIQGNEKLTWEGMLWDKRWIKWVGIWLDQTGAWDPEVWKGNKRPQDRKVTWPKEEVAQGC